MVMSVMGNQINVIPDKWRNLLNLMPNPVKTIFPKSSPAQIACKDPIQPDIIKE